MQLDKTMLDRLLSLDDQTLSRTIKLLADAVGIDEKATEAAVHDLRHVRATLSNATDADIEKAAAILGKDRTDTIIGNHYNR